MDPSLILLLVKGVLRGVDLIDRVARTTRNADPSALDEYIKERAEVRKLLLEVAKQLGSTEPGESENPQAERQDEADSQQK